MTEPVTCHHCEQPLPKILKDNGDWVCENHPDTLFEECECGGAGMPPPEPILERVILDDLKKAVEWYADAGKGNTRQGFTMNQDALVPLHTHIQRLNAENEELTKKLEIAKEALEFSGGCPQKCDRCQPVLEEALSKLST